MNRVISSYAPSLSNLVRLHRREKKEKYMDEPTEAIVVSMPETAGRPSLDLSTDEAAAIAQNSPNSTLLKSQTREQVLSAIAKQPHIVHFSCHGELDYSQPLLSTLLMSNWQTSPLTVADLQMLNIKRSQLAFLSACFTANTGVENMRDEGNYIAGALHCAGFWNVVYVGELAALEVTRRFYKELAKAGENWTKDVAKMLHFAVMDFRENTRTAGNRMRGDPVSWAPFSHFGG
jgi:CHAT domain-containing protein